MPYSSYTFSCSSSSSSLNNKTQPVFAGDTLNHIIDKYAIQLLSLVRTAPCM